MKKFDVVIVGAGPTGYFCAYELVQKNPNLKICLIDKGWDIFKRRCPVLEHKLEKCPSGKTHQECYPHCSITNGFGGAGAYSDGKFNITTEFGGWLGDYMDDEDLINLIKYVDDINLKFGATKVITNPDTPAVRDIEFKAMSNGVRLLKANVRHLGTEENLKILSKIFTYLSDKIEMRFTKMVNDIVVEDGKVKGVVIEDGEQLEADYVVLGVGREGSKWLESILNKVGVEFDQTQVDMGVRVECPNMAMEEVNENLYEGKFLFYPSTGMAVRTFCNNPGGHVVVENYEGVINVNGHSYSDSKLLSKNTNFALLVSHHFSEPFKQPNEYAKKVSKLANQLACGSVIVQRYGDLKAGRRTNEKRLKEGFVRPTLKEAVPGDLRFVLPYATLQSIIEMMEVLNKICPGIATEHTLLYGVEAKYYSSRPEITNDLEIKKIKNLYVGGDGAGLTRGLAQAGASGVYIARKIVERN